MTKSAPNAVFSARARRRGASRLYRLFVVSTALATPAAAGAASETPATASSQQDQRTLQFAIPAGPLDAAIAEFRKVTGLRVVFADPEIGTVQSPGVTGSLTSMRALEMMLDKTLVRAIPSGGGFRLEIRAESEFVSAQAEASRLSSPKYQAPLLDTPQTITVIPRQVIDQQAAISLREVLRDTPGVAMGIGEGTSGTVAAGDNVFIRGMNARNDIYVDGARDVGEYSRDTFNTESVEIAKGPTSATGGRGATGGSINMVSKNANLQDSGNVRITGGSADYARATFDVNRKLTDSIAFRVNGMYQNSGYPGRDVAKYKGWGLAPSLALGLGTPTQVTLNYSRLNQDNVPDWGLPALLPDVAIAQGITVNDLDFSNWYSIASRDYEEVKSDVFSGTVSHKFTNAVTLRNLTRYSKHWRDAVLTAPRPATSTAGQGPEDPGYNPALPQLRRTDAKFQHRDDQVTTNQTDLTVAFHTGRVKHASDFGVEIAKDNQPTYAFADLYTNGRPPVVDLFNPNPEVAYAPAYARTGATSEAKALSTAVYAFDNITLSEKLHLDLGLRWDHVDVDYTSVATTGVATLFGRTDSAMTGRGGVVFKPKAEGSIYAAVSTSFAPSYDGPHGLFLAATGVNSQALPPEQTRNIELGTKWEVKPELMLTAAFFDMVKTNAKTTNLAGAIEMAGEQRVRGVELSASGEITETWTIFGGIALMNGEVIESGTPSEIGAQLAYVPKTTANVWTTYRPTSKLMIGGGANFNDGNFFNQTGGYLFVSNRFDTRYVQNAATIQGLTRYLVFNAVGTYQLHPKIQLQVNLTNIGNERYADRAYDRHFLPGATRQILIAPVITF